MLDFLLGLLRLFRRRGVFRDPWQISPLIGSIDITGIVAACRWSLVSAREPMAAPQRAATTACPTMKESIVTVCILIRIIAHFVGTETNRDTCSDERGRRKVRGFAPVLVLPTTQGTRASGACAVNFQIRPFLVCHLLGSQPWVFRLRPVTPHGRFLSPHQSHISQLGVG